MWFRICIVLSIIIIYFIKIQYLISPDFTSKVLWLLKRFSFLQGRKSRKERRAFRERTLVGRKLSPPRWASPLTFSSFIIFLLRVIFTKQLYDILSYAWRKSPSYEDYKALVTSNRSRSKSSSPVNSGKITYITSFGGDEPATPVSHASK